VRVAVRGVVELVAPDGVRSLVGKARRGFLVMVRIAVRHGFDDPHVGAERAEQGSLLGRLVVGHHDHAAVAALVAEMHEADAGIARRALDERAALADAALAFRHVEDCTCGAVLDRAAGVQELGLS
jgi:hypothetical protein